MFNYIVRRLLLMIPTFIGTTLLVFVILMIAPGNPFDKAVQEAMQQNAAGGETVGDNAGEDGGIGLSENAIEQLRKQYSLDKPIIVRYLVWLGFWPRLIDDKTISLDFPYEKTDVEYADRYKIINPGNTKLKLGDFITLSEKEELEREKVDFEASYQKLALQKWLKVEKKPNTNGEYIILESGVGSDFKFTDQYAELPFDPENHIYTWYISEEWEFDSIKEEDPNKRYDEGEPFEDKGNGKWDPSENEDEDVLAI